MFRLLQGAHHQAQINDKSITVHAGESLLQAAERQHIAFPSICRVGGCGACKCRLLDGRVEELTETAYLLSEKEIANGYILACQSRLRSDIRVELDSTAVMPSQGIRGVITARTMLTHDTCRIDVQLEKKLAYRAGQYAELLLDSLPDAPRSYSFATAPRANGSVSFIIRRQARGRVSNYLMDQEIIGSELTVRGPGGQFWLRPGKTPILMVAGGSGLAPILAMLEEIHCSGDYRPVRLLFGARTQQDLYALHEIARFSHNWPDFSFHPVISDEPGWTGLQGLVTEHISTIAPNADAAYLCGPPAMVDAASAVLRNMGMAEENIHSDRFLTSSPRSRDGFYGAVGLPKVQRPPASIFDYLKYFSFHAVGVIAALGLIGGGCYTVIAFLAILAFYIGGDAVLGDDTRTPAYGKPWILTAQLWLALPLLALICFCFIWTISPGDPLGFGAILSGFCGHDLLAAREHSGLLAHVTGTLLTGLMIGILGTVTAHELTHRTWDPVSLLIGRWLLAFSYDTAFAIEHVYGHHRYVSTKHDPATAPRGRNVYTHIAVSTVRGNISAWEIESERLRRKHLSKFSWHNAYLRGWLMSVLLAACAWGMAGWHGVAWFSLVAILGKALLEIVNYMEHYGMVRQPEQPVQPRHSWNTNSRISSWGMFNLTRHSHHHAQGEVPYQDLMPLPEAPMMIGGYLTTIGVALLPPLWHHLMTPRLIEWDRSHASAPERELAWQANQQSALPVLQSDDPRRWNTPTSQ